MEILNNTEKILKILDEYYPDARPELEFSTPFELLVATILSAQCTDVRVNLITRELFKAASTPQAMLDLGRPAVMEYIASCGMYQMKSQYLIEAARMILEDFDGTVPDTVEALMTLPGVGRKTANVVASNAFGVPAIAVDTHVFRVANRLGLASASTVEKTEQQLMERIPPDRWILLHHQLIYHGRRVCKARGPQCGICRLSPLCPDYLARQEDI